MMEKVETMRKQKSLSEIFSSKKAKYIIGTILLSGIGIALPQQEQSFYQCILPF